MEGGKTRLVIISGRALDDLTPLLALKRLPEIWGSHGGERLMADGTRRTGHLVTATKDALKKAAELMGTMGRQEDIEQKPFGVALHWRDATPSQRIQRRDLLLHEIPKILAGTDLSVKAFDGGLEVRSPEISKGKALNTILDEMGTDPMVAYLGDDLTDEDAFTVMRKQLRGLGILVRETFRETKADLWIRPPGELLDFLKSWQALTSEVRRLTGTGRPSP
jgi:trehalose-phosphatase